MTETPECRAARVTLQRAIVGVEVAEQEFNRALAHLVGCETCRRHFPSLVDAAESRVDPADLFERALAAVLSDPGIAPDEAPFIAKALARVTGADLFAGAHVIELAASSDPAGEEMALGGREGVSGMIQKQENDLWLKLNRLPTSFENTKPIVVLPEAVTEGTPAIRWSGAEPGLVPAPTAVSDGSLEVLLGEVIAPSEQEQLFQRVYLVNPEAPRRPS